MTEKELVEIDLNAETSALGTPAGVDEAKQRELDGVEQKRPPALDAKQIEPSTPTNDLSVAEEDGKKKASTNTADVPTTPVTPPYSMLNHESATPQLQAALELPFSEQTDQVSPEVTAETVAELQVNGLEMSIEVSDMKRRGFFQSNHFASLFFKCGARGEWMCQERSESQNCEKHAGFIKKFAMRGATEVDRDEVVAVALFEERSDKIGSGYGRCIADAVAVQEVSVGELVKCKQMMKEKQLHDLQGGRLGAKVLFVMEMVYYVATKHDITVEFGILGNVYIAPKTYFVMSRALKKGRWTPVYKSEVRLRGECDKFECATIDAGLLHGGDPQRLFRLEVYGVDKEGEFSMGFMQSSVEKMKEMEVEDVVHWWAGRDGVGGRVLVQQMYSSSEEKWFGIRLAGLK